MPSVSFFCPHCSTYLNYTGVLPNRTNCPVCQSQIYLNLQGQPSLTRVGPPAPQKGARTLGGAALGALLGAALGGAGGAVIGGILGGIIGGASEQST